MLTEPSRIGVHLEAGQLAVILDQPVRLQVISHPTRAIALVNTPRRRNIGRKTQEQSESQTSRNS